jgi:hypothetical protein
MIYAYAIKLDTCNLRRSIRKEYSNCMTKAPIKIVPSAYLQKQLKDLEFCRINKSAKPTRASMRHVQCVFQLKEMVIQLNLIFTMPLNQSHLRCSCKVPDVVHKLVFIALVLDPRPTFEPCVYLAHQN